MKIIAAKIGVKLEKIPERPRELIESIPFPHKCVIRQSIHRIRQDENEIEAIIQQLANFYGVDAHLLLQNVQEVIQYYKERRNNRKSCEKNPNKLKWISKRLSRRFNLPEEKLFEEVNHLVKQYIHSKKEVNGGESQKNQPGGEKKTNFHPARCDSCNSRIQGIRYWCLNCRNYDLCSTCEEKNENEKFHDEKHIFAKIKNSGVGYRVFPGAKHQGVKCRVHVRNCGMEKKICKESVEDRLNCLQDTVKLLEETLKQIQIK